MSVSDLEKNHAIFSGIIDAARTRVRDRVAVLGGKGSATPTDADPSVDDTVHEPIMTVEPAHPEPVVVTDDRGDAVLVKKRMKRNSATAKSGKGRKKLATVSRRVAKEADKTIANTPSDEEMISETAEDLLFKEERRKNSRVRREEERIAQIDEEIRSTSSDEEREEQREGRSREVLERARGAYFDAKETYEKTRVRNRNARTGLRNVFSHIFPLGEADREERVLKKIYEEKERAYEVLIATEQSHERALGVGRGESFDHEKRRSLDDHVARFGLKWEDCARIDGFEKLSEGQKFLVFENLAALTVGKIDEQARANYQDRKIIAAEAGRGKKGVVSFAEKMWSGFRESFTKDLSIAKQRKMTAQEIMRGGTAEHGEALRALVTLAQKGPEVRMANDGSLSMNFTRADAVAPEKNDCVQRFNDAAHAFANVSRAWSTESATQQQKSDYARIQSDYEAAKDDILRARAEQCGNDARAMGWMASIEATVHMQQFFSTQRKAVKQLERTVDAPAIVQSWKEIAKSSGEYVGYVTLGFASRMALAGWIGFAAGPVSAAAVAALRTRFRVSKELREKDTLAQQGQKDRTETAKNIVDAKNLAARIEQLLSHVRDLPDRKFSTEEEREVERDRLLTSLATRLDFTSMKMTQERVNYGIVAERTANQYALVSGIAQAQALLEILPTAKNNKEVEKRLQKFLAHKEENIWAARQWYRNVEQFHAVSRAAAFGALGGSVRWIGEELGWWGAVSTRTSALSGEAHSVLGKNMPPENLPVISSDDVQISSIGKEINAPQEDIARYDRTVVDAVKKEDVPASDTADMPKEQESVQETAQATPVQEIVQQADAIQPSPVELTIQKGSSFEGTLIDHLKNQGLNAEEAGRQAHRMALQFAADHDLPSAPHIVHPGDKLVIIPDPDASSAFVVKEFHAEKPATPVSSYEDASQVQATISAVRSIRQEFYGGAQTPFANVRALPATEMMDATYFQPRIGILRRFLGGDALPRSEETVERYTQRVGRLSVRRNVAGDILKALKGI